MKIQPVILCGGSGTRLWPMSRADFPKQFIEYAVDSQGIRSLFKSAVNRLLPNSLKDGTVILPPVIVASQSHKFIIESQLSGNTEIADKKVLLEPTGKNTAACVTLAALNCIGEDPILIVLPSDHAIDNAKFREAVLKALPTAEKGAIVLLGIKPTNPTTGYGYIEVTEDKSDAADLKSVVTFHEKPNKELAVKYYSSNNFFWNAGIFILKASVWLKAIQKCRNDIYTACEKANRSCRPNEGIKTFDPVIWSNIPSESVDYAVLEHCQEIGQQLYVVPFNGLWTDLGSWSAVHSLLANDDSHNFIRGDVLIKNSKNTLILSNSRLVVANGLDNIAVVETPDSVLVTRLDACQDVKQLVQNLKENHKSEAISNRKVYRPWGYYDSIDEAPGFKVKRIVVNPGQQLSLQLHHHRAEHWVVTQGEGVVQIGDAIKTLQTNQSVFIPMGVKHRLSNKTNNPLCIVEVQTGNYLGEDDIVRFDDIYGRI